MKNEIYTTQIKLLIEKNITEIERLKGVRDRNTKKEDKEYFQGHIDSLHGTNDDLYKLIDSVTTLAKITNEQ